ncbi:MAG: helix-turn-helix transcriptional regulator [Abitibacteriaceae bacterium]|nr:helix-turn-helix transcriptional regulator [Abditibacteriaceae bacterium]
MDTSKRQKIEAAGYRVMTVAEFLEETPAESAHIEIGLALSNALKARRLELGLTQKEVAQRLGTKQPNIARLELGVERSVTLDLLMEALLELGVTRSQLGAIVAGNNSRANQTSLPPKAIAAKVKPTHTRSISTKAPKNPTPRQKRVMA